MIPDRIVRYLQRQLIPFARRWHPRAVSAQTLAASLHVSGHRVAKTVVLEVDGRPWLAVLPASTLVDLDQVAESLGASEVRLAGEEQYAERFFDCELGAEPPFGLLFGMPVIVDERLDQDEPLVMRAGSHDESLEISFDDFRSMEKPIVTNIARVSTLPPMAEPPEMRM